MKRFYKTCLTIAMALFTLGANAEVTTLTNNTTLTTADNKVVISDMSLTVAEGEQIDEDGDFKVTFNYKVEVLDENIMPSVTIAISVYDADGNTVVESEDWTLNLTQTARNIYVSNLVGGKTYTIKVDQLVVKDNSKIDWETVFEGEELYSITEGLPTLQFTPVAGEVIPVEVKDMKMSYDRNALIDEDGDYAVTFSYTAKVNDENIKPGDLIGLLKYEVYDENYAIVATGKRDFQLTESSRNVYISGLTAGKTYYFLATQLDVYGAGSDPVLTLTSGLPKLTFKVKDPNAQQAITMSDMKFTVAEGEQIDEDGDFKITFNYVATINDASAVQMPFASVEYEVYNEAGEKIASNVGGFSCEETSKNLYISNLEAGKTYTIKATKVEIQDYMTMDMLCSVEKDLPTLTFTVAGASGINAVAAGTAKVAKKVIEGGKIIILAGGKKYSVNAVQMK